MKINKFYGAFVLNRRVVLHPIDATPARWCGDAGSSPLDRARSAAPDTLVDFHTGDDEGRKVAVGLLLGDARDRSAFPRITRAVEKASPDARYRLHRAALAGCRLRNDESRAAQLQQQIHAEGLEALRPAATVLGRMVPFENGRAPSKELDALCELLGDRYEPHLRALPYAFAGDAAAGARSLKYHAEKKALAHLLADDAAELRVDVNFKMCADCHGFFKAASAVVDRPIHVSEGGRPAHTFRRGQCSCGDAWRWEERLRRDGVPTEEALAWRDGAFEHAEGPMAAPGSPRIRRHAAAAAELRPTAAALAWRAAAFQHAEQPMAVPRPDDDERGAGPPQVGARAGRGPKGPPV